MSEFVLASGNAGKLREFNALLGDLGLRFRPLSEFDAPEVDESGLSFVENAILKARSAAEASGLPAMADDSGLEVDALDGQPGIFSARFSAMAGGPGGDAANNALLLERLEGVPEAGRSARFQCVIVLMRHALDPTPLVAQGSWEGRILFEEHGENGFGYDPLFWVPTHGCSSAQLDPAVKNAISHRAQALAALKGRLQAG